MHEKLRDRSFDLITWYAEQCWETHEWRERTCGQPCHDECQHCAQEGIFPRECWYCPVGDVWGHATACLLNSLQPYPGDESPDSMENWFDVEYYSEAVSIIHDRY
jgi:hypothetical protein